MLQTPFYEEVIYSATSITIPSGWNFVEMCAIGAGGAGKLGGGGSGALAQKKYSILPEEWGTNLSCSIGIIVTSGNGGATSVDGTLNGAAITQLFAGGGTAPAFDLSAGTGGTASGGDTNIAGNDGTAYDSETQAYGLGGAGQETMLFKTYTYYGHGGDGGSPGNDGGEGLLEIRWSL